MRCKKIERWIPDSIDGEASAEKKEKIQEHIQKCSLCRAYRDSAEKIQKVAKDFQHLELPREYWKELPAKMKEEVSSVGREKKRWNIFTPSWKWAWMGAGLVLVVFLALYLVYFKTAPVQEYYVFSFEDSINMIYEQIGDDPELEDIFNTLILASITDSLESTDYESIPDYYDELTTYLGEYSEEELNFLETEIKNEINS